MRRISVFAFGLLLVCSTLARAEGEPTATFALIIGVNRSVDPDQQALKYADDDAAQYFALFRTLGARAYVLTRADDNTRRVHPQAVVEAGLPTRSAFEQSIAQLAVDVARARAQNVKTTFYFVYAGHGNVRDGQGYIALEDHRLTGQDLARVIERVGADQAHLIIDACYSFYLAYDRGPGGHRRAFTGLKRLGALAEQDKIGLLLSTSSARESHEWEGFQAGVFSHEVRSGLYGAADADGDGQVSYREIAAFVERANAAIANERFRPDVYARPPHATEQLLDLRPGMERHVEIPSGGHYIIESGQGVRLAELHNAYASHLLRPSLAQPLYVRKAGTDEEYLLPATPGPIALASLEPQPVRARERGAAHEAFSTIFSQPFDVGSVASFQFRSLPSELPEDRLDRRNWRLRTAGITTLSLGGAALVTGAALSLSAYSLRSDGTRGLSQSQVEARNHQIDHRNTAAVVLYGAAGAFGLTGAVLLIYPRLAPNLFAAVDPNGGTIAYSATF